MKLHKTSRDAAVAPGYMCANSSNGHCMLDFCLFVYLSLVGLAGSRQLIQRKNPPPKASRTDTDERSSADISIIMGGSSGELKRIPSAKYLIHRMVASKISNSITMNSWASWKAPRSAIIIDGFCISKRTAKRKHFGQNSKDFKMRTLIKHPCKPHRKC